MEYVNLRLVVNNVRKTRGKGMIRKVAKGSGIRETASKEKESTKSMPSNIERKRMKLILKKIPKNQLDNVMRKGISITRKRLHSSMSKPTSNKGSIDTIEESSTKKRNAKVR